MMLGYELINQIIPPKPNNQSQIFAPPSNINNQHMITPNYLTAAYLGKADNSSPILQILAFEENPCTSETQPIIIRLSDMTVFVDCFLAGPFEIKSCTIVQNDQIKGPKQFRKYDLVKLTHFSTQLQHNKISKLKLVLKDLDLIQNCNACIGRPAELVQHTDNIQDMSNEDYAGNQVNSYLTSKALTKIQHVSSTEPIKIEDDPEELKQSNPSNPAANNQNEPADSHMFEGERILTGKQILEDKQGIFIGRLVRMKMTSKETKEGQLSVLILGLLDHAGDLVRMSIAGRAAIKQFKELKKKKCYYIKGIQTFQTEKMPLRQIKIKQKQSKVVEINNEALVNSFRMSYYHWDHDVSFAESERVDVIGIVDEIDDQTHYEDQSSSKFVVRVTIKNIFKSVKISFWADQIQHFKNARLKKRQAIILEDIRKKKSKFLDFTYQSSIVHLSSEPELFQELSYLLPEPEVLAPPKRISEISAYIASEEQKSTKIIQLSAFLISIEQKRIIYKLCQQCKRKVELELCKECKCNKFQYKYNCLLEFADFSGTVTSVAFDGPGSSLFGKTAEEMSMLSHQQLANLLNELLYSQYAINIESKNLRFLVRSIEKVALTNRFVRESEQNIKQIRKYLHR